MTNPILFIGGPKDGRWEAVEERCLNLGRIEVVDDPSLQLPIPKNCEELNVREYFKTGYYQLKTIKDENKRLHRVFVYQDVSNVFELLLNNYKP